jgi:primosomal protein N''
MTSLQRILNDIGALPQSSGPPTAEDLLCDAQFERELYEAECDRLRDVLAEALAIIESAARETMLDQAPYHAIHLLNEDEQRRLYNLLKGDGE